MLLTEFVADLKARGKSPITVQKYVQAARNFCGYLHARSLTVDQAHDRSLREYTSWLVAPQEGVATPSPATVHLAIAGVRSYLEFLRDHGVQVANQKKPDAPVVKPKMPVVMSRVELERYACLALKEDAPYDIALLLLPFCGLRVSELCRLRLGDVIYRDLAPDDRRYILHTIGKGGVERLAPVFTGPQMAVSEALHHYLTEVRGLFDKDTVIQKTDRWLFPATRTSHYAPISTARLEKTLASWRDSTGVPDLHPHLCRAHYATALLSVAHEYTPPIDTLEVCRWIGHRRKSVDVLQEHYAGCRLDNASAWMGHIIRPSQVDYHPRRGKKH